MLTKNILKSKTFWFNIVMTLVEIGAYTETIVPASWVVYAVTLQGVGNIILRVWFNKTALTIFGGK